MSHYSARVEVADGTLHVSRPLTAPDPVDELVESARYAVVDSGGAITAVSIEVDTPDESATPIGDSVTATSSTPINSDDGLHEDVDDTVAIGAGPVLPGAQS